MTFPIQKTHFRPLSLTLLLVSVLALASCGKTSEAPPPPAADAGARAVSVATVSLRPMAGSLTASGLLLPREEAAVGSELSGFRVAEVLVDEGATVTKGQVMARLDAGLLAAKIVQAEAGIAQAKAQAGQAQAEADRVKGLDGTGILSDEQIGSRRAQASSALASVQVAQAQLNELRTQEQRMVIRAPVAGTVLERTVKRGDVASTAQTMFRIARDGLIELDAEVPEDALSSIQVGEQARVTLPSGVELEGVARLLSPRVDPKTKLGRVRVQLPVHAGLRSGGYAQAVFSRAASAVPVVPEKAVQFEASGPLLIVIDKDSLARRVAVKTAARSDGFVAIEDGPPLGTRVALGGGAFLLDGDLVDPIPAQPVAATPDAATADAPAADKVKP